MLCASLFYNMKWWFFIIFRIRSLWELKVDKGIAEEPIRIYILIYTKNNFYKLNV